MRIGFLGNANNYPFMLARAMRRSGQEVLFILNHRSALNRPERRYDDVDVSESSWIVDAGDLDATERYQFLPDSPLREQVIDRLRGCDAVVLNHGAISLAPLIARPHIAFLTGTDVQRLADPAYATNAGAVGVGERVWLENAIARQRFGIATAGAVSVFPRGMLPSVDLALDGLGVDEARRFFCWMTDTDYIRPAAAPRNDRVRIFNVARLTWAPTHGSRLTEDHKGSDVMIMGLAEFCRRHPEIRPDIRLVEKGMQVNEAKELVGACGLSPLVTWLGEMTQREVLDECRRADIVLDQLGGVIVGMGGLDAMAIGRPLIANARPEIMHEHAPEPPICQAATVEEVVHQLERLVMSAEERQAVGYASREYVERYCSSDHAARHFVKHFESVLSNPERQVQWSERLLEARLGLVTSWHLRVSDVERLAEREEMVRQREKDVKQMWEEYDSLRIVRWRRKVEAWKQRIGGRPGRT